MPVKLASLKTDSLQLQNASSVKKLVETFGFAGDDYYESGKKLSAEVIKANDNLKEIEDEFNVKLKLNKHGEEFESVAHKIYEYLEIRKEKGFDEAEASAKAIVDSLSGTYESKEKTVTVMQEEAERQEAITERSEEKGKLTVTYHFKKRNRNRVADVEKVIETIGSRLINSATGDKAKIADWQQVVITPDQIPINELEDADRFSLINEEPIRYKPISEDDKLDVEVLLSVPTAKSKKSNAKTKEIEKEESRKIEVFEDENVILATRTIRLQDIQNHLLQEIIQRKRGTVASEVDVTTKEILNEEVSNVKFDRITIPQILQNLVSENYTLPETFEEDVEVVVVYHSLLNEEDQNSIANLISILEKLPSLSNRKEYAKFTTVKEATGSLVEDNDRISKFIERVGDKALAPSKEAIVLTDLNDRFNDRLLYRFNEARQALGMKKLHDMRLSYDQKRMFLTDLISLDKANRPIRPKYSKSLEKNASQDAKGYSRQEEIRKVAVSRQRNVTPEALADCTFKNLLADLIADSQKAGNVVNKYFADEANNYMYSGLFIDAFVDDKEAGGVDVYSYRFTTAIHYYK